MNLRKKLSIARFWRAEMQFLDVEQQDIKNLFQYNFLICF